MGCQCSRNYPENSLFSESQLARLRDHFDHFYLYNATDRDRFHTVFYVKNHRTFENYLDKFFKKYMKWPEDFVGFVRAIEILVYGQTSVGRESVDTTTPKGSIERLADVIQLKTDTKHNSATLTKLLLAIFKGDPTLIEKIRPQSDNIAEIQEYFHKQFPVIENVFPDFLKQRLLGAKKYYVPHIPALNTLLSKALPFIYLSSSVFTHLLEFHCLYLSRDSILSFKGIEDGLEGYPSSLMIIIKLQDETVIGGFVERKYKKRKNTYEINSFLFSFANGYTVLRQAEKGNIVFLNLKSSPRGLGFGGGTSSEAKLWISEDIDSDSRITDHNNAGYTPGLLLKENSDENIEIIEIELWGCGDELARQHQIEYKNRKMKMMHEGEKFDAFEFKSFLNEYPL
ncbi:unnamed protein product [Blepharisma stoltei]|uniref:TLDc domain-containing protein n=1 Tax=Blepharisma stoltei TaxID=1481888 RepID=A0AAU9IYL0_9CILI|nr:unnamed protein product [Blepharisma stoltei]